jgi:hypothetical protein
VHDRLRELDSARRGWSEIRPVLIADADLAPGDPPLTSLVELPAVAVPPSALDELPDGARLRQRVADGEVLVGADVTAASGPAAAAEPGTVVVPFSPDRAAGARPGLPVRVVAEGIVLADRGEIVAVGDEAVHVAVPASEAPAVAAAVSSDLASLLYLP